MKTLRRNFLKTFFISLSIVSFVKFDLFSFHSRKTKLKKNKNFIWYLNNGD